MIIEVTILIIKNAVLRFRNFFVYYCSMQSLVFILTILITYISIDSSWRFILNDHSSFWSGFISLIIWGNIINILILIRLEIALLLLWLLTNKISFYLLCFIRKGLYLIHLLIHFICHRLLLLLCLKDEIYLIWIKLGCVIRNNIIWMNYYSFETVYLS
jgi:hypothetical protein